MMNEPSYSLELTRFVHTSLTPREVRIVYDTLSSALVDYGRLLEGCSSRIERDRLSEAIDNLTPVCEFFKNIYNTLAPHYGK